MLSFFNWLVCFLSFYFLFIYFSFLFNFIFSLYNTVLVLPYIDMNPPQVYMSSQPWTSLPPPSPFNMLSFYSNRLFWCWFIHFKRKLCLFFLYTVEFRLLFFLFIPYWSIIITSYFNFGTKSFQSATCLNAGEILLLFCALSLMSFLLLLACFVRE